MDDEDIRRTSLDELKQIRAKRGTATRPDAPAYPLDAAFWASALVVEPAGKPKAGVNLSIDQDVLDWFRHIGRGDLSRMNVVLRSYMEAHR